MNLTSEKYQVMPELTAEEFAQLKADIVQRGVQVPVEYDEDGNILDGYHRVRACRELRITDWPRVIRAGLSEEEKWTHARKLNLARRHLNREKKQDLIRAQLKATPAMSDRQIAEGLGVSDKTVGAQRKEMERTAEIPQLKKTIGADGKERPRQVERRQPVSIFLPTSRHEEETRELIRAAGSGSGPARKAIESLARLDATPRTAKSEFIKIQERQNPRPAPAIPAGCYRTLVADPPWRYQDSNTRAAAEKHYGTMSTEEICGLPVKEKVNENAHLYLWTTNSHLPEALQVARAWGFTYKTMLTWVKPQMGLGHYFRGSTEHVLFCVRGNLSTKDNATRNWFESPRAEHSQKPEVFYQLVEKCSPGPYLELFARRKRPGWQAWGNEVGGE
ncbi:MAG: hypothetical protein A4E53_03522 [Pelotomaculum sp. PtaB.Bin104]|nr:MAG: hypothetical protein A4E53_03522 [Pelotomaculum sp. PtaB.Bin104]